MNLQHISLITYSWWGAICFFLSLFTQFNDPPYYIIYTMWYNEKRFSANYETAILMINCNYCRQKESLVELYNVHLVTPPSCVTSRSLSLSLSLSQGVRWLEKSILETAIHKTWLNNYACLSAGLTRLFELALSRFIFDYLIFKRKS